MYDLASLRYERARERELGMMMGQSGVLLTRIEKWFEQPGAQVLVIAACAGLLSLCFFRAAWVRRRAGARDPTARFS